MMNLQEAIKQNKFVVTAELAPVKGTDLSEILAEAVKIKDKVNGINVTDNQRSIMRSSPLAFSRLLIEKGINPICQITARDRNRLALQSDLLGASILGIKEILLLTGDAISSGDHPDAKAVFDLDSIGLIKTAKTLMSGYDLSGRELNGKPDFFIGAAVNPGAEPAELQAIQVLKKIEAGAQFFQTQLIYDVNIMKNFLDILSREGIKAKDINIIAGIFPLKSLKQALFFNEKIPGVKIPDIILKRLEKSKNQEEEGLKIALELIQAFSKFLKGVHLMTMGNKKALDFLLDKIN